MQHTSLIGFDKRKYKKEKQIHNHTCVHGKSSDGKSKRHKGRNTSTQDGAPSHNGRGKEGVEVKEGIRRI